MKRLGLLALAAVGIFLFAGCSDLPTKPLASAFSGDGASSSSAAPTGGSLDAGTASMTTAAPAPVPVSATRVINGLLGGTVRAGNFTVIVPPTAIRGTAMVTVTQPDPARPVVELSITPPTANGFRLPVLLVADARPMSQALLSVSYISYWNPSTGQWERVANSSVNLVGLTVTAPLWHFSTYRVDQGGKAGW